MNKILLRSNSFAAPSLSPSARHSFHAAVAGARQGAGRLARLLGLAVGALLLVAAPLAQAASVDALVKSVKFDDDSGVKKMLDQGMNPNQTDSQGTPLIVLAAREKSDKVGAVLLADPKTDLEATDKAGENAMMMAALNGDVAFVQLLLSKDAEVNKKGWTPLHYAATNGHDDVVKLLLDHSAYVDAASPNGTTPLMMAARGGYVSTLKLLLDNGADVNAKNQIGLTALDFAKQYHEPDAIKGLTARMQQTQQQAPSNPAATTQNHAQ